MKKLLPVVLMLCAFAAKAQNYASDSARIEEHFRRTDHILNILREFRFQAYAQVEWQKADTAGIATVQGGSFPAAANNRFIIRRGRFKLSWQHETVNKHGDTIKVGEFAFQYDATEKGFNAVKDFYGRIIDPWTGWVSLQGGIFLRPFGYETPAAPATHESPEFSRMNQTIFPNECELGEAIVVESPRTFKPVYLRFDAAVVNGEGIGNTGANQTSLNTGTYQSAKDFVLRIILGRTWKINDGLKVALNGSASYYNGRVMQTTNSVFEVEKNSTGEEVFKNITAGTIDTSGKGHTYYNRDYYGAHLQLNLDYKASANLTMTTMLRGEFIAGTQPGQSNSTAVPLGAGTSIPGADLYIRQFNGGIFYLTQSFHDKVGNQTLNSDITFKMDVYDPNTKVGGSTLTTTNGFSKTDLKYTTLSAGYTFCPVPYFKIMFWYDHVINENSGVPGWSSDYKKDDVFTLRTQFMIDSWWFDKKSTSNSNLISKTY